MLNIYVVKFVLSVNYIRAEIREDIMKENGVHTRLLYAFHRIQKINFPIGMDISRMEFFALQVIGRHQQNMDAQGIYVSELAQNLHIASSQTSRMLKNLEERNLIGRCIDGKDRRNTYVYLTEEGTEACRQAQRRMKNYMNRVKAAMGEERIEEMVSLCNELADIMEREAKNS